MKNEICIIIPTRTRLEDFKLFADSWMKTTEGKSIVVVSIDNDDTSYDELIASNEYPFIYERQEQKPFLKIVNDVAVRYAKKYDCVGFMEDDCTFNTPGWETAILNKINEIGNNAIVWCEDLVNHDKIVGLPFMNSNIVRTLGWMSPPEFDTHWIDHFWFRLGTNLNSLYYFPDIVIEHRHFSRGKREKDEISEMIEKQAVLSNAGRYMKSSKFKNDLDSYVTKLKK